MSLPLSPVGRFASVVFCAVLFADGPARAADFVVGSATILPGQTAIVPLTVTNAQSNLSAFALYLTNASMIGVPAVAARPAFTNLSLFVDNFTNGTYRVTGLLMSGSFPGNGVIGDLSFSVPQGAATGVYPVLVPGVPPTNAPWVANPEARSTVTSSLLSASAAGGVIYLSVPPFFSTLTSLGGGQFSFRFTGTPGVVYNIQASSDLTNWAFLTAATNASAEEFVFNDLGATNQSRRFYRVVAP